MWSKVFFYSLIYLSAALADDWNPLPGLQVNPRWYPKYHQAPSIGWMNDPNGFSIDENGVIHLFYQYNPKSSLEPGIIHWGHAISTNFFDWEQLPIALYPDEDYDKEGVFSGSAIVEDGTAYIYYTARGLLNGEYTNRQALATTKDFKTFTKYENNPIIQGDDLQPDFRDPKVWKKDGTYYMVLGNSFEDNGKTHGRVLLYTSQDKYNWNYASIIDQSNGTLGYMWECPDFFEVDNEFVLLFSPQGIEPQGDKYRNLFQTGYILGKFDYNTNQFKPASTFYEIDHGHDFYATQTIEDKSGRRILIGWLDMWSTDYPEKTDGFTGQMTIPRVLTVKGGKVYQWPVEEISQIKQKTLRTGPAKSNTAVRIKNNAAEVVVEAEPDNDFTLLLEDREKNTVSIAYSAEYGTITLDRGGLDAIRRTAWKPKGKLLWTIYIDSSSIELFAGEGEVVFSSRFFPTGTVTIRVSGNSKANQFTVTELQNIIRKTRLRYEKKSNKNIDTSSRVDEHPRVRRAATRAPRVIRATTPRPRRH